jgi:hypothetical protein
MMRMLILVLAAAMAVTAGLACQDGTSSRPTASAGAGIAQADAGGSPQSAAPVQPAKDEGGVRSIELPTVAADLPPGPGRDTITGACAFCHSNQYILMQPRFTRPQWTAEVDKMRKTYGAPLTDPQAAEAVNYLAAVRGTEEPATKPVK